MLFYYKLSAVMLSVALNVQAL